MPGKQHRDGACNSKVFWPLTQSAIYAILAQAIAAVAGAVPVKIRLFNGSAMHSSRNSSMPRLEKGNPGGPGRPRGSRNIVHAAVVVAVSDRRPTPHGSPEDSRILEISRNVSGRGRKIPRDQALADRSDAFLENPVFFEREAAELASEGGLTPERIESYLHLALRRPIVADVEASPARAIPRRTPS